MLSAKQGSSNSHLLTSFGWRGQLNPRPISRSTDEPTHIGVCQNAYNYRFTVKAYSGWFAILKAIDAESPIVICFWQLVFAFTETAYLSWEPEGCYCRSTMFRWEPEGRYCHWLCTAIAPFWFSTEHLWAAITPFWLSTDDMGMVKGDSMVPLVSVSQNCLSWTSVFNPLRTETPKYLFPRGNKPLLYHQIGNRNFFIFITNQ